MGGLQSRNSEGQFSLSGRSAGPSFTKWRRMKAIIKQHTEPHNERLGTIWLPIGAMLFWPQNRIGRKQTVNQHQGFRPKTKGPA